MVTATLDTLQAVKEMATRNSCYGNEWAKVTLRLVDAVQSLCDEETARKIENKITQPLIGA